MAKSCHLAHPTDPILSGVELNFAGKAQILGFCGGVEALNYFIKKGDKYKPGDLLGAAYYVADEEDELWVSYQEKELNNGRLAMVAVRGLHHAVRPLRQRRRHALQGPRQAGVRADVDVALRRWAGSASVSDAAPSCATPGSRVRR